MIGEFLFHLPLWENGHFYGLQGCVRSCGVRTIEVFRGVERDLVRFGPWCISMEA